MCKQIAMFAISVAITLLIFPLSLSSQNNFSLSLDANTATGNQSVTSVNTSAGQVVAIQVFGSNLQNAIGFGLRFEYDVSQVTYQGFDPGNVLPGTPQVLPEHGTNPTSVTVGIASFSGQSTVSSGLVGTIRFRTTAGFSGTEIRLVHGQVSRGRQVESLSLSAQVELQVGSRADFDDNGTVGISDFLLFVSHFGSSLGQAGYDVRYDLDSNGSIGISDFLIFANDFGRSGGTPTSDDHNNIRSGATVLSLGGSRSGRIETGGDVDYFRVQVSASGTLTIYTTGNTDTVGRLENNSGSVLASNDDGGAFGNFRIEQAVSFGTYYIRVAGYDASITGDYTLHASFGGVGDFNIELVFVNDSDFTDSQKAMFQQAAYHWMSIITADIQEINFSTHPFDRWDPDFGTRIRVDDTVDDLRIFVGAKYIDGLNNIIGQGGPLYIRENTLPILGKLWIDTADLQTLEADGILLEVILHEMGHALGIGTVWEALNLLRGGNDLYFAGPRSIQAFDDAGGRNYNGAKVPIESDGGHWRESVFGHELMTPTASHVTEPLSAITVQSLADIGYQVDVSQADAYSLPPPLSGKPVARQIFHWGDCIPKGPIYVSDENGRVIHIIGK